MLFANIVCAALLILAAYNYLISPAKLNYIACMGLGFPVFLIINLAFLLFWILFNWKMIFLPLVTFIVCWGSIYSYIPMHIGHDMTETPDTFSLLTYNVYHWVNNKCDTVVSPNETVQYILDSNADIVCLQEGGDIKKEGLKQGVTEEQIEEMNKKYPFFEGDGEACYSRFPILSYERLNMSISSFLSRFVLDVYGKKLNLFVVHLESIGLTRTDKELYKDITENPNANMLDEVHRNILSKLNKAFVARSIQADTLAEILSHTEGDIILCGDFNDTAQSYAYHTIRGDMRDAYIENGFGPGISYNSNRFWFRIDHILYSGDLLSTGVKLGNLKSSDHYPIMSYFVQTN